MKILNADVWQKWEAPYWPSSIYWHDDSIYSKMRREARRDVRETANKDSNDWPACSHSMWETIQTSHVVGRKEISIGRVEMLSPLSPEVWKVANFSFNRKSFTEVPPMRGALKDSKESCNLLNMCPKQYLICSCFLSVLPGHLNLGQLWSHIFDLLLCNVFERHIRSKFHGVLISHNSFLLCILKNGFLFLVQ